MYKNNDIKLWKNYGIEVKDVRNRLARTIDNPDYQKLLPRKKKEYLVKAFKYIEKFRNEAENEMFKRTGIKDITIWYP
jgi:hypothetical protein